MNFKLLSNYITCVFIFTVCCTFTEETSLNQTYSFEDTYTFEKTSEVRFPLDSVTPYYSRCSQYFTSVNDMLMAVENSSENRIYLYNLNTKELIKFISFEQDGPEGIGQMEGFYIHTLDSIFVPSTNMQALFLLNQQGKVVKKYAYPKRERRDLLQIFFTTDAPAILFNHQLYFIPSSFGGTKENPKNAIVLDLKTETWEEKGNIPDTYNKGFFGAINFYHSYYTYNPNKGIYVHSFPIDNYVYAYDLKDSVKQYYAGSKYLKDVKPLSDNPFNALFEERSKYFKQSPSYLGIHYDQYRKFYYRIAQQPISDALINDPEPLKRGHKHFSIVILDENLQKVGEYSFKEKYTYGESIIAVPEGLMILNFKKCQQNEDYLYYDIFKIVKKNEK